MLVYQSVNIAAGKVRVIGVYDIVNYGMLGNLS